MITNRRTLTYVAIALIVGAALALAVALAGSGGSSSVGAAATVTQTQSQGNVLGDTTGAGTIANADPAKQQPPLDKFTAKDPFVPLSVATPTPSPTSTSDATLSAHITVNGTSYTVVNGDKVPSSSPAFTISGITSSDVTFAVSDGTLENGDSSITVNLGESVTVTLTSGKSYDLSVVSIGSSGGGGSVSGHTISVLSISTSNGVAVATLQVDGTTYSDKSVGDVFSTPAGEIKVIAINVDAQTVTIMLGDQTLTLQAGQVVVK